MSIFRALWISSLLFVFGGTAIGQTVTSTYDKDYGLARLRTYEFKAEKRDSSDPLATDTLTENKIKDALGDELLANSYHTPPDGASPDFLISFHVKLKEQIRERGRDVNYIQGILIVDFYDAETKKMVWRGVSTGVVGKDAVDLKLAEEGVKQAAKLLLAQLGKDLLGF